MKQSIIGLFLFFSMATSTFGQKTEEDDYAGSGRNATKDQAQKLPFRERLVIGGNIGGYFGNYSYFQINPMVGYKTTPWWVNGVGLNYIYAGGGGIRQNVYGASLWSRAYVRKSIILHTEYEQLMITATNSFGGSYRADVPVWFVGGGYQDNTGRIGLSAMVLFDLIQDPQSPYSTPVFRIGGLIGF